MANYGSLASSFVTLKINDSEILALARGVTWARTGEATGFAFGVGNTPTSNILYQKPFAFTINFSTFDIYDMDGLDTFNLEQISVDGSTQVILSKNRPQLSGSNVREFDAGTIIFSGVGAGRDSMTVTSEQPIILDFSLNALDKTEY